MAAALRNLAKRSFAAPARARFLSTSALRAQATPVAPEGKHALDYHTVEDLHHMSAEDILSETGTRKDATMRHFTGETH